MNPTAYGPPEERAVREREPAAEAHADAVGAASVDLTDVLVKALRALGDAGRPVQASRLAARAWWMLRADLPRQAEHVNGAMHYLARLPAEAEDADDRPGHRTGTITHRKDLP